MKKNSKLGFSLLEVSVVLLIIGILLASVSAGKSMIKTSRLTSAKSLTANSPVVAVDGLAIWLETVSDRSFAEDDTYDFTNISGWQNLTNYFSANNLSFTGDPSYRESAINDLPSVNFDGNDSIDINTAIQPIVGTNFAIFIVEKREDNVVIKTIIDSTDDDLLIQYSAANIIINKNGGVGADIEIPSVATTNIPSINYISFASSANCAAPAGLNYYRNKGVFVNRTTSEDEITADGTHANTDAISSIAAATLGATTDGYNGNISEIVIYNQSLTFLELEEILNYLSSKYKIPLTRS